MIQPSGAGPNTAFNQDNDFGIRVLGQTVEGGSAASRFAYGQLLYAGETGQCRRRLLVWTIRQQHQGIRPCGVRSQALQGRLQLLRLGVNMDSDGDGRHLARFFRGGRSVLGRFSVAGRISGTVRFSITARPRVASSRTPSSATHNRVTPYPALSIRFSACSTVPVLRRTSWTRIRPPWQTSLVAI